MQTYFTSDIHFFHTNIIKYCNRPWESVSHMNEGIIENWNRTVQPGDNVYILGDVAMGGKRRAEEVASFLERLHGNLYLVAGNHDTYVKQDPCRDKFVWIKDYHELTVRGNYGKQRIVLSHYPMVSWHKMGGGSWMLHGHCHHTLPPDYSVKRIDVGIDGAGYGYKPISFEKVASIMSDHGNVPVDHHNKHTNEG